MASEQQPSSSSRFNRKKENIFARLFRAVEKSSTKQKFVTLTIFIVAVCLLAGLSYLRQSIEVANQNKCSSNQDLLSKASAKIQSNDRDELASMIPKIEQFSDHNTNPNCLIPLTAFYIYKANEVKASDYMTKLQEEYSDDKVFAFFITKPNAVERYKVELEGLKMRNKEIKESTLYY